MTDDMMGSAELASALLAAAELDDLGVFTQGEAGVEEMASWIVAVLDEEKR